jgi:hypothetical protein
MPWRVMIKCRTEWPREFAPSHQLLGPRLSASRGFAEDLGRAADVETEDFTTVT